MYVAGCNTKLKFALRNQFYFLGIVILFVAVCLKFKLNPEWQLMEDKIWHPKDLEVPPDLCPKARPCSGPMLMVGGICVRLEWETSCSNTPLNWNRRIVGSLHRN